MSQDSYYGHRIFTYVDGELQELKDEHGGTIQFMTDKAEPDAETHTVSGCYSDRMFSWDSEKFNRCAQEVWGNTGQYFYSPQRTVKQVEQFLQLYFGKPELVLTKITHYINQSNGYPLWFFGYHYPKSESNEA